MKSKAISAEEIYLVPEEPMQEDMLHINVLQPEVGENSDIPPVLESVSDGNAQRREIPELRESNRKVYRMGDGTEQAVYYPEAVHVFNENTHVFEDMDTTLVKEGNSECFVSRRNGFVAKFSCEENNVLFSVENGMHRVAVLARNSGKQRNSVLTPKKRKSLAEGNLRGDTLVFENVHNGADYEYSVTGNGVKEDIIVKEKANVYRYAFMLRMENVTAMLSESNKRISFISKETGEEVFFIPTPFMTDANGAISTAVVYELRLTNNGDAIFTVTADSEWINDEHRVFPVVIDPQIQFSSKVGMTTYSWYDGHLYNASRHIVGVVGNGNSECAEDPDCYSRYRMYMSLHLPTLPRNPRIKKAELRFFQAASECEGLQRPKIGLYHVTGDIATGFCTPYDDSNLLDYAQMQYGIVEGGSVVSYTFDITSLIDEAIKGGLNHPNFVLRAIDEFLKGYNFATIYGSASGSQYAPQCIITYESNYGVNSSYRTHTHELGRFGQGSIDLLCGNLMFESEDFQWLGNRMPVTIKHLYNSALCSYPYTANSAIALKTADFSAMKLGYGFKLNIMQSMMPASFPYEGKLCEGYVYIGENGDEVYFKENTEKKYFDDNCQCYHRYEAVNNSDMVYDPEKQILKQGEETYYFDNAGRLIQIQGTPENKMGINYTYNKITSVTDGAGREFGFGYNNSGFLTSITAPDGSCIRYAYSGNFLSTVTYPDNRKAVITYSYNRPTTVTLHDENDAAVYKVTYAYHSDRVSKVTEYGVENGDLVLGTQSAYTCSIAAGNVIVETTEQRDVESGESSDNVIKTVYTFDDEGNIVSEYVYSEDTGNVGADGGGSGINPHSGDGGASVVSNINNLLTDHDFRELSYWCSMPDNNSSFEHFNYSYDPAATFGMKTLYMRSYQTGCSANGVYQTTNTLPAGEYTFSAYLRVHADFSGSNAGAYIRVTDVSGNILGVSERLTKYEESEYTRLIVPFSLTTAQSVQVQILVNGKGVVYANAPQLENNPYANAYNMLENGNFERGIDGWEPSNYRVYTTNRIRFNMSQSLMINGDLDAQRNAKQTVYVKTNKNTRETFTLSGWAKGRSLPKHHRDGVPEPTFRLRAKVCYNSSLDEPEIYTADFSPCTQDWQMASIQFAKSQHKVVKYVEVYCDYDYNMGVAYFDDIQLVRNSIERNLSASDFVVEKEENLNETEETTEETTETTSENASENTTEFREAVDGQGNALTETTFTDGEFGTIYRAFGYTPEGEDVGNNLEMETDSRGYVTTYEVDGDTSRNECVVDRCGNKTVYEYDISGRTTNVMNIAAVRDENGNVLRGSDGNIQYEEDPMAQVSYGYDAFDNMTDICRGDGLKYMLAYNAFHNLESIGVDGKNEQLVRYTYKAGNGRLKEIAYANGDKMKATYNSIGQMVGEKWFDKNNRLTAHYKYVYDGQGNIVRSIDIVAKKEYNYEYEEGKLRRATEANIRLDGEIVVSKTVVNTTRYYYDAEGTLTKKVITARNGNAREIVYETTEDNTVVKFSAGGRIVTSHSKTDTFGRKAFDELQLGTSFVSRQFSYHTGEVTDTHKAYEKVKSSPTTQLVSQIVLSGGRTISYKYDEEERITEVVDSVESTTTTYTYDALGQLLTETVNGEVVNEMTYDNYGNILTKNGNTYTYGDGVWKDKLTAYCGRSITYDAQGNPTNYMGYPLTWEKGRQLKSFGSNTYTYNANGIRTSKTVDCIEHIYTLDGAKILREEWDGNTLIPLYDNEDSVCGILYNGEPFYFQKNLQGDVIAIVNKEAEEVARYTYDAWGVCTIQSDFSGCSIATINPFRYRSYYYDDETGLYYLQSRYYDPYVGRFLNADEVDVLTFEKNIFITNLYQYCANDSVNAVDLCGNLGISSLLSAIGDSLDFIFSIGETAVCEDKKYKNLSKQIKNAKSRDAKKKLIKEQKKLLKLGVGKGLFYVVKIFGFILLVMPYLKYVLDWARDRIIFVEFVVSMLIDAIIEILCTLTSKLIGLIPAAGIVLGFAGSWLIGKLLDAHFSDSRRSRIAQYYNSKLHSLTSFKAWVFSFGYALSI